MLSPLTEADLRRDGPDDAERPLILAHGAGAAMDSPWMEAITSRLAVRGVRVYRFEFPYMRERRRTGKKKPSDRAPMLQATWRQAIELVGQPSSLVIGGKSLGGRMASLIADDIGVAGLICFGFPFHAPGRTLGERADHLEGLATPALILQGERDPMGSKTSISGLDLSPSIRLSWLTDGDHSLKPRKLSGKTLDENLDEACDLAVEFIAALR
jgi:uncharacterized protein